MKQVLRYDENGFFVEPVLIDFEEEIPSDCTDVTYDSLFKPKWNGYEWVEGLSQEEIDAKKNQLPPPTEMEKLRADVDFILMVQGE